MAAARRTRLTYGRGKLYFEPESGGGEIYVGNTPSMVISYDRVTQIRYQSFGDQRDRIEGPVTEEQHAGKFVTDDMTAENLALWFGHSDTPVVSRPTVVRNVPRVIRRGRYYSIGETSVGERSLTVFNLRRPADNSIIPRDGNYDIDFATARMYVHPDATDITDDMEVIWNYRSGAFIQPQFNPGKRETIGALRYISNNPLLQNTAQMQVYWPRVRITTNSDWELKSEQDFLQVAFKFDAMRGADGEYSHVILSSTDTRPWTEDEYAIIIEGGITLEQFPPLEDELDRIVNTIMPSRGYPLDDIT